MVGGGGRLCRHGRRLTRRVDRRPSCSAQCSSSLMRACFRSSSPPSCCSACCMKDRASLGILFPFSLLPAGDAGGTGAGARSLRVPVPRVRLRASQERFIAHFNGVRDGTFTTIRFDDLEGLISMPSFHVAGGMMVTGVSRLPPAVRLPVGVERADDRVDVHDRCALLHGCPGHPCHVLCQPCRASFDDATRQRRARLNTRHIGATRPLSALHQSRNRRGVGVF